MPDSSAFRLPYAPTLYPMPSSGIDELKRSLDYIVMPGELLFDGHVAQDELRACRLTGGGVLATAHMGRQEVRHDNDHLRWLTGDDVVVLVALAGRGTVTQQGCTLPFAKGDITFRRARVPSVARIEEPAHLLMIRLPITRFLGQAVSRHAQFRPQRADAASGIVKMPELFRRRSVAFFREHESRHASRCRRGSGRTAWRGLPGSGGNRATHWPRGGANRRATAALGATDAVYRSESVRPGTGCRSVRAGLGRLEALRAQAL
ncbi:hypothetical protein [Paraburkholderia sp. SIMBA_054]|uniref:AraC-like ligand-binding domain-containing protein n=1 Tax=Paraburkholderia TaxID=1822464 RepID=UPI00397C994C